MEPTILTEDDLGRHNKDLTASTQRIINNGSWKKQRVVTVIPAGPSIPTKVYLSHMGLIFPPNQAQYKHLGTPAIWCAQETEVGEAFSTAFEQIVNTPQLSEWEYLLTIEHDNIPPGDGLVKLIASMEAHPEFACIGGLYWTKGEGGVPQIWGDPKDPVINFRPQPPDPNGGLVECYGTGMGFNLWRMSMLRELKAKKVPQPWFKTQAGAEGVGTQDLYFWSKIGRPNGYRCAIDCGVKVGHLDPATGIAW